MPLSCGHNGYFSHREKLAYEWHLIRSGLFSDNPDLYSLQNDDTLRRESVLSSQTSDMFGKTEQLLTT
jgi:hypothetical protein